MSKTESERATQGEARSCAGPAGSVRMLEVGVCVFADGTTVWVRDPTHKKLGAIVSKWRERNPTHPGTGGVVLMRMPESDYQRIPATRLAHELTSPNAEVRDRHPEGGNENHENRAGGGSLD